MKLSRGFWQTYKEVPADAEIPSHKLMMRAGLIHKSGAGLYNYLPMGYRTVRKIEQIVREEMDRAGCHELLMSVVTPGELWQESGRWDAMGGLMLKFKDKGDRDLCISPTNEEAITDIFRKTIKSYKDLPVTLYQINTKFRDEIRPRFGLMRGREFTMKDAYSFHMDKACLDRVYDSLYEAYERCFVRMGLTYSVVEADGGAMASSDSKTHEFQVLADTGEDQIIHCPQTGYAANIEKATTLRQGLIFNSAKESIEEVPTPQMKTIEDVCNYLSCPQHHSLKSLVYKAISGQEEQNVLVLLLGDDTLNEIKLKNALKCDHLVAMADHELEKAGFLKGFIGPYKLSVPRLKVLFDRAVDVNCAYIVGANQPDLHYKNFIPSRDLETAVTADLRLSKLGDVTPEGHSVEVKRGIEVGHIFQLGDKYTKALNVKILDHQGKLQVPLMGCYGIGITRIAAAAIEQNHDEKGIVWPVAIAPYQVYFAFIGKDPALVERAEAMYGELQSNGLEVVFDDRNAGAGFKFKDAELLGLPIIVVLGEKVFKEEGVYEVRERKSGTIHKVAPEELVSFTKNLLGELQR
jgi:prolyl-tRNA synthetase